MPDAFRNEPPIDFSQRANRERFAQTLAKVREQFKERSRKRSAGQWLDSLNPANPREIVGQVRVSTVDHAQDAIERAARFFPEWRRGSPEERAKILSRAAATMREKRWELAAWEVFEVGKSWREADADIVEAIDYLNYYAREMLRLGAPRQTQELPGEINIYFYEPRGIAVIIAPWNFPLAILTGMTAAALAAGNCALLKPAEQSPVMAVHLIEILRSAGVPEGACQLLQGGGELGAYLVRSPEIHLIAF
ncbi:MAG TPA: aldehyde dehydrogenase family protein, partial [Candidatus Binatia bacterium]|nr:aldehyde dehydrogenase family protein [Candidatus Binatia bacterium]